MATLKYLFAHLILPVLALAVFETGAQAQCAGNGYLTELQNTGDDFRAVSILKEQEFKLRGTAGGLTCGRMLLGQYLKHSEYDLADTWLSRMFQLYPASLELKPKEQLSAEMSYLFGNPLETIRRIDSGPAFASAETLRTFAEAEAHPLDSKPITCTSEACLRLKQVVSPAASSNLKSPALALGLGIIPGLGQIYAGRTLAGLSSFVLNSVLIGTTIYAFNQHENAFGVFSAVVGTGLYTGSIYAGVEAAQRHNELQEKQIINAVRGVNLQLKLLELAL